MNENYTLKDLIKETDAQNDSLVLQVHYNKDYQGFSLEVNNNNKELFIEECDIIMKLLVLAQSNISGIAPSKLVGIFIGEFIKDLEMMFGNDINKKGEGE